MKLNLWWRSIDKILISVIFTLIFFGILLINVSTQAVALRIGIDYYSFINKQIAFLSFGSILIIAISMVSYENTKKLAIVGFFISLLLLIAVNFLGYEAKGSKRWINIIGISFQPSEFTKTFFSIFNGIILSNTEFRLFGIKMNNRVINSFLVYLVVSILLISQPDFGMFLVFSILWFSQLFIAGISNFFTAISGLGVSIAGICAYIFLPHVRQRISLFSQKSEMNYQVSKSLLAFKNGKLFGTGIGEGTIKRILPDSHTDFIFAVAAEEFGGIFCLIILTIFLILIVRVIYFCIHMKDEFTYLSLIGLIIQVALQVFINIGVSLNLLPTKGMTLPLISYGGSSTLATCILFGIIINLTKSTISHSYKLKI